MIHRFTYPTFVTLFLGLVEMAITFANSLSTLAILKVADNSSSAMTSLGKQAMQIAKISISKRKMVRCR